MIGAEILKLRRQRASLFWGFLLVPAFMTLISLVLGGALLKPPPGVVIGDIQLFRSAIRTVSVAGNPIAQLFFAIGGAAIFAVEYRYSGWRHIVPRASRERLILAKFATFALFAAVSLALALLGDMLVTLAGPLLRGAAPVIADASPAAVTTLLMSFVISLAELLALGATVALVAVATRSGMGAIIAPFMLALGAGAASAYLGKSIDALPYPGFAAETLRGAAGASFCAWTVLLGWTLACLGAAIALFRRQDLVSE
jgi:hypothetical protein